MVGWVKKSPQPDPCTSLISLLLNSSTTHQNHLQPLSKITKTIKKKIQLEQTPPHHTDLHHIKLISSHKISTMPSQSPSTRSPQLQTDLHSAKPLLIKTHQSSTEPSSTRSPPCQALFGTSFKVHFLGELKC